MDLSAGGQPRGGRSANEGGTADSWWCGEVQAVESVFWHLCCWAAGKEDSPLGVTMPLRAGAIAYDKRLATNLLHIDVGLGRSGHAGPEVESHVRRLVVA